MKLEIISVDFIDTIYGITLDEGRSPCLSSLSEEELATFNIPEIEPALWFKTLVLTRVTLDCVKRHMTWATDKSRDNSPRDNVVRRKESVNSQRGVSGLIDTNDSQSSKGSGLVHTGLLRQGGKTKIDLKRLSESVFLHCSNVDQCTDIEELFRSTDAVVDKYKNEFITKVRFYEEMFRILHCYILPAITFTKEDVPQLEAALEFQNALIQRQDQKISSKDTETSNVNESMTRQRENYASDVERSWSGQRLDYPRPLAVILLNHFQDDLQMYSTQLAGAQADVNLLKAYIHKLEEPQLEPGPPCKSFSTSSSISDECPELKLPPAVEPDGVCVKHGPGLSELQQQLKEKRLKRDKIFQKYKQTLHIREIMGEYVSDRVLLSSNTSERVTKRKVIRSKLHMSGNVKVQNPLHKIYMGLVEVKKGKIRETKKLVEEKVRLVSVKEGIRAALEELQTASTTYGIEFDQFGSLRSTDIMARPRLPTHWQTLEEQVKQIVDDPKNPLSVAHTDGCDKILSECKLLLKFHNKYLESESETDMQSGSPDTTSLLGSIASPNGGTMHGETSDDMNHRKGSDSSSYFNSSDDFSDSSYSCSVQPNNMCVHLHHMASQESRKSVTSTSSLVELEETSNDLVIIHDVSSDYARKAVEKLQKQIKAHMESMSRQLLAQMDRSVSLQKVWTCYERIFFTVIYSDLKKIYKLAYMDVLHGLEEAVPKLTPFSLAMDNSIVYPLFCDVKLSTVLHRSTTITAPEQGDSNESVEDSVFVSTSDSNGSVVTKPGISPTITRLRSDSTVVKAVKRRNRETLVLTKDGTSDLYGFENHVNYDGSDDLSKPPVDVNGYPGLESVRSPQQQDNSGLKEEFDEFLEICNEGRQSDKVDKVTDKGSSSLPGHASNLRHEDISKSGGHTLHTGSTDSNFNIDLAESLISGTVSGHLMKELAQGFSSSDTSADRMSVYSKSKYANVLEQINMDYARNVQKNIHICYPVSVNVSSPDRSTWPLAAKEEDLEVGQDVLSSMAGQEDLTKLEDESPGPEKRKPGYSPGATLFNSASSLKTKTIQIKPEYKEKLEGVVTLFEEMCKESTPTEQLKKAFLALRELGNQFVNFTNSPLGHGTFGASADELSDFLVVLLCNIDMKLLLQIYISAQMMRDLMAEYLETGPYGFSVMQLIIGLHFLQERIVMQRGLVLNQWQQEYSVMC